MLLRVEWVDGVGFALVVELEAEAEVGLVVELVPGE